MNLFAIWTPGVLPGLLLAAGAGLLPPAVSGFREPAPRPLILIVHGRGQQGRDTSGFRLELQRSIESGLRIPTVDSLFRDDDIRLVWYADVLDPRSQEGCRFHEANPRSRERWASRGGAQAFWDLARGVIGAAAAGLDSAEGDGARSLLGDLLFAADLWKRCGVERRVAEALDDAARDGRPVILVSHSFGAIVTYGLLDGYQPLSDAPRADIRRWVTVGSMLGVPAVRQLLLGDMGTALPRPNAVKTWVNIRDPDDAFSARAGDDSTRSAAEEIETELAGGSLAHEITTYFRDPRTSRAIAGAWCRAFAERDVPKWCTEIR